MWMPHPLSIRMPRAAATVAARLDLATTLLHIDSDVVIVKGDDAGRRGGCGGGLRAVSARSSREVDADRVAVHGGGRQPWRRVVSVVRVKMSGRE